MKIDYDKFSEEELEALQRGDYDALSEKSLRYLSAFEQADTEVEPTTLEALSTGFVEGVPFLKDAVAGVDAIAEEIASDEPMSLENAVQNYRGKLEEANETINRAEEMAPVATGVGDFIGSAVSAAGGGIGATMVAGAASGLSRSEDRSAIDLASGAALGAAGYGVGKLAAKGIKGLSNFASRKASEAGDEAILGIIGMDKVSGAQRINRHVGRHATDVDDFVKTMRKKGIVDFGDTPEEVLKKVQAAKEQSGANLGKVFKAIDDEIKIEIPASRVRGNIKQKVAQRYLESGDEGTREIGKQISQFVDDIGWKSTKKNSVMKHSGKYLPSGAPEMVREVTEEIIDEPLSVLKLNEIQKDISQRIHSIFKRNGADATVAKEQERLVAKELKSIIDDVVGDHSDDAMNLLKAARKDYGHMAAAEELLVEKIQKVTQDPTGGLKQWLQRKTFPTAIGILAGGPTGAGIALAADYIVRHPKTPAFIANGMPKLANLLATKPAGRLAAKITAAAGLSNDKFHKVLRSSIAELNLLEKPMERDVNQVLYRRDDITNYLVDEHPTLHKEWLEIIDNGSEDEVAMFMDKLSETRSGKKFVQEGMGWSGRVFNDGDKAVIEKQVRSSNYPASEKARLLKELYKTGKIPVEEEIRLREPNNGKQRNKQLGNKVKYGW